MNVHLDKIDDAINDLWRLLGVPLLNCAVFVFLFQGVLFGVGSGLPIEILADRITFFFLDAGTTEGNADAAVAAQDNILHRIQVLVQVFGDATLLAVILLAFLVFLLDSFVRAVGSIAPYKLGFSAEKLATSRLLDDDFAKFKRVMLSRTDAVFEIERYDLWQIARHWLDSQPEMSDYKSTRLALERSLDASQRLVGYLKGYVILILALPTTAYSLYPLLCEGQAKQQRFAMCEAGATSSGAFAWYFFAVCIIAAVAMAQRVRYLNTAENLLRTDIQTFLFRAAILKGKEQKDGRAYPIPSELSESQSRASALSDVSEPDWGNWGRIISSYQRWAGIKH